MYIVTSNKAPMRCLSKYSCTCCAAIFKFTFSNTLTTNICRNNYVLSMLFTAISISQETLPRGLCAYSSMAPKGCGCLLDYSCPLHDRLVASKNLQEWGDSPSNRNLGMFCARRAVRIFGRRGRSVALRSTLCELHSQVQRRTVLVWSTR